MTLALLPRAGPLPRPVPGSARASWISGISRIPRGPGPPGPVRSALRRRRERIVVLPLAALPGATVPRAAGTAPSGATVPRAAGTALCGTALSETAPPGAVAPASRRVGRRRGRALAQQCGAPLASPGRARREREVSQAAIGHQKSVFP
ncbi:hypothetical protein Srubr_56580 [Streptomyces rubradiris]|uniref:Uncharacterized protein n=1 Tax=Streptomyces rubradiris TaxID=285531 RepID=A0ABQ3RIX4_STRRR|nr:hypothetical protein GCM10018792_28430 [Streptomyces rubradiris]GHI55812.1 hypothetical protein Srubr_56580 [Streptomyces rubradiris]